ncbi:MAG: hypothetical protein ACREN8_12175, partial [Candidatus Dormibacteraceae bacterium]
MAQRVALEVSVDWLRRRHRGVISRLLDRLYDLPWHLPAELLYPPLERFWLRIRGGIGIFFGVWGPVVLTMIAFLGLPMSTYISDQVQVDCTIRIPGHPLDSQGLATPWVLSGGNQCLEKKNSGAVFAEAMVLD